MLDRGQPTTPPGTVALTSVSEHVVGGLSSSADRNRLIQRLPQEISEVVEPTEDTVFLVSGGAKGITAACVKVLAERFHSRFILVGRSKYGKDADPAWANGIVDEAALMQAAMEALRAAGERPLPRCIKQMVRDVRSERAIRETLDAVAAAGGRAVYVSADVTDATGLQAVVAEAEAELGAVSGVLHGAGVLADKLVKDKAVEDFDRVVSVKVDGLRNLLACVPLDRLAFLVLFSSVAGFYGNIGQSDYAVANETLNKVAHWVRRRAPHCRVLAMNWGPWDGGMVTPALRKQLAARNVEVIAPDAGTKLLADLLGRTSSVSGGAATQIVVGSAIKAPPLPVDPMGNDVRRIRRRLSLEANPFLIDHVIGGHAVLPTVCAVSWMIHACEQWMPGYRYVRVDDYQALKGIVFDRDLADSYILELKPAAPERLGEFYGSDRVVFDALVLSHSKQGAPRYHYRAKVTLAPEPVDELVSTDAATDRLRIVDNQAAVLNGPQLYTDKILFHGPSFRGIDAVLTMDESGLTMRCHLPALSWSRQGQFPVQTFNPYAVDVHLQSLLIWSHYHMDCGGLPLRIGAGVQVRPLPFGATTYAQMTVRSCTKRSLVADVSVFDAEGRLCMAVGEAEITLSRRLNTLFADNRLPDESAMGSFTKVAANTADSVMPGSVS